MIGARKVLKSDRYEKAENSHYNCLISRCFTFMSMIYADGKELNCPKIGIGEHSIPANV